MIAITSFQLEYMLWSIFRRIVTIIICDVTFKNFF